MPEICSSGPARIIRSYGVTPPADFLQSPFNSVSGGKNVRVDGLLACAVRPGGICGLEKIVEARRDVTVIAWLMANVHESGASLFQDSGGLMGSLLRALTMLAVIA